MPRAVLGGVPVVVEAGLALHLTNPPIAGERVRRAQELLVASPYGDFHPGAIDGVYGPLTAGAVRRAKRALGYPERAVDGVFGERLRGYLEGEALPAAFAARRNARLRAARGTEVRQAQIVAFARWGIANEERIHYRQLRPIDGLDEPGKLPLETDCSGFVTLCYRWAGAPDPNGRGYDGQGYTGTLLERGRRVPRDGIEPADLVVFGPYPGHHVALVLEPGDDPLLVSHGQERGPLEVAFSVEVLYQPAPATWLRALD